MRLRSIARESALNLATGTTRAALWAVVFCLVVSALIMSDMLAVADIHRRADEFRDSGASTLVYRARGAVDGVACDALRNVDGVTAAGAVRQRSVGLRAAALPAGEIPTYEVSPAFGGFRALGGARPGAGILVSEELAATLGIGAGDRATLAAGASSEIGGVYSYPADGRQPGYGYAVLVPTAPRAAFDECWVDAWPASDALVSLLPTVLRPGSVGRPSSVGEGLQLTQLNMSRGSRFDGAALFDERVTAHAPWAATTVAFAVGVASVRIRRLELAAARHAGIRVPAQVLQLALETAAWVAAATLACVAIAAVVAAALLSEDAVALTALAVPIAPPAAAAAMIGSAVGAGLVRERNLFRYFKTR